MNTLIAIGLSVMIGLGTVGCSSEDGTDLESTENTVEEPKDKKEEEVTKESEEEKILTVENDEEFKKYIYSSLSNDEYEKYFTSIEGKTIEFDATVMFMELREGYDTRYEMLLAPGDTSLESDTVTGPGVKVKDTYYGFNDSKEYEDGCGVQRSIGTTNDKVTVKGRVAEYDSEKSGCLIIEFITMKKR